MYAPIPSILFSLAHDPIKIQIQHPTTGRTMMWILLQRCHHRPCIHAKDHANKMPKQLQTPSKAQPSIIFHLTPPLPSVVLRQLQNNLLFCFNHKDKSIAGKRKLTNYQCLKCSFTIFNINQCSSMRMEMKIALHTLLSKGHCVRK